jgi:hypothetical protein
MALQDLVLTKSYAAFQIYRQSQIDTPYAELEAQSVIDNNNFRQIALDVFGAGYVYTNDGLPQFVTPINELAALVADNETITGSWTFQSTVEFQDPVNSLSTFSSSGQPRAKAYRNGVVQSIVDNLTTDVDLNAETYDIGAMHNNGAQSQRLLVPSGGSGSYIFSAQVTFAASNVGRREVSITKNGSQIAVQKEFAPDATETTVLSLTLQDTCGIGDQYDLQVYQDSGGPLDVEAGELVTYFTGMKVW